MAFDPRELSVLAYANGFTLWHYRTRDGRADLTQGDRPAQPDGGYFAAANELLRRGDQIVVNLEGGNRPAIANLVVTMVEAGAGCGGRVSVETC
jgi:hypothetical protein